MKSDESESMITEAVIGAAMVRELALRGVRVRAQSSFPVRYKGRCVGEYAADLVVEGKGIVELKCVERLGKEHLAQCLNYLKASGLRLGLVINFQRSQLEGRRVVFALVEAGEELNEPQMNADSRR